MWIASESARKRSVWAWAWAWVPDPKEKKTRRRTVLVGIRKGDHVFGEDLGDAADAGGDDVEARTGCFEDGDAKRFGERRVKEDGAADQDLSGVGGHDNDNGDGDGGKTHVAHVAVSNGPEQLDSVLEEVALARLEQVV